MTKKTGHRVKHIPQRTCVGCRETLPKRQMVRIIRTSNGVQIDPSGKMAGRGAYLHDKHSCWSRGLKGVLANALKTEINDDDRVRLEEFMNSLPVEAAEPSG